MDGSYWQVQLGGKRRPEAAKSLSSVSEVGGIAKRTRAKAKGGGGGKPPKPKAKAKARGRKGKNGGRRGIVDELDEPAEPPRPPTMQEQADAIGREAVRMARPWERFALFIRVSDAPNVCRMTTVMPLPRAPLPQVQVQPPPPRDDPMEMG
uniref:Uncharacterized protein n=1 Tax=Vitrella brassicaformis TaxID=1169539 RepID=A0A7S1P4S9_9ALVE